jgi:hypothetical protein
MVAAGQVPTSKISRTPGGTPDLSGIWQALNTANWDLQAHGAEPGPDSHVGAIGAVAPVPGVVDGGEIPYLPAAAVQRKQNYKDRWSADPEIKCYMPGVPRATYMPYPFQIIQGSDTIMMSYEFADAVRLIPMKNPGPAPADSWMGWSVGHWDGDALASGCSGRRRRGGRTIRSPRNSTRTSPSDCMEWSQRWSGSILTPGFTWT